MNGVIGETGENNLCKTNSNSFKTSLTLISQLSHQKTCIFRCVFLATLREPRQGRQETQQDTKPHLFELHEVQKHNARSINCSLKRQQPKQSSQEILTAADYICAVSAIHEHWKETFFRLHGQGLQHSWGPIDWPTIAFQNILDAGFNPRMIFQPHMSSSHCSGTVSQNLRNIIKKPPELHRGYSKLPGESKKQTQTTVDKGIVRHPGSLDTHLGDGGEHVIHCHRANPSLLLGHLQKWEKSNKCDPSVLTIFQDFWIGNYAINASSRLSQTSNSNNRLDWSNWDNLPIFFLISKIYVQQEPRIHLRYPLGGRKGKPNEGWYKSREMWTQTNAYVAWPKTVCSPISLL